MSDYFEYLWKIVDDPSKFEIVSYLIVSIEDNDSKWYLTPKTRDGKRDGEGFFKNGKNYFEAKYLTKKEKKLLLDKVSSSIINAFYNKVSKLWIFTNREISLELMNFVSKHHDVQNQILKHSTEVILFDGRQTAISLLKHPISKFTAKNLDLGFIGYKSVPDSKVEEYRKQNIETNKKIISKIKEFKKTETGDFFSFSTIENLAKLDDTIKQRTIENYFKLSIYFLTGNEFTENISVSLGDKFLIYIRIDNYFHENINYNIHINPSSHIDILGDWEITKDGFKSSFAIEAISSSIVTVSCKCEEFPIKSINFRADILSDFYTGVLCVNKNIDKEIYVSNKLFFSPYIFSEKHNVIFNNSKNKVDKCYLQSKYNITLITGRAGSGKTRFIEELILHAQRCRKTEIFNFSLISDSIYTIINKILSFFLIVDIDSYSDFASETLKAYYNNINFNSYFKDDNEFENFHKQLELILKQSIKNVDDDFVCQVAEFIGKLILKLSKSRMVVITIEDLHYGEKYFLKFILELNKLFQCQPKCQIMILLAARLELKESSIYFERFKKEAEYIRTHNIESIYIDDLGNKETIALIRELLGSVCSKDRRLIQKISEVSGNNPFYIIHTLLQLRNNEIILQNSKNEYYWANLHRLNKIDNHKDIKLLFDDRFAFYNKDKNEEYITNIVRILTIFKSKVPYQFCKYIFKDKKLFLDAIDILIEERIINVSNEFIKFEHENIYNYAINNLMLKAENIAEQVHRNIQILKNYDVNGELNIRALYWCSANYEKEFFDSTFLFFNQLLDNDLWEDCVYYGNLFIYRSLKSSLCDSYSLFCVKFRVLMIESQYYGVPQALDGLNKLELDLFEFISNNNKIDFIEKYHILSYEIRLNKSDILIIAEDLLETELCLNSLEHEIVEYLKKYPETPFYYSLKSYLAWIYNRRGVMYKKQFLIEKGQREIKKGLKIAQKINHEYYIHHCYYDLCIGDMLLGKYKKALANCRNSKTDILELPKYRNAKARTLIQYGFIYRILNKSQESISYLSEAIDISIRYGFYFEVSRALLYLANVYMLDKRYDDAQEVFIKALAYTHINQGISLKLGVYSGYTFNCLNRYLSSRNISELEEGLTYYQKLFSVIMGNSKNPQIQFKLDFWKILVAFNLKQLSNLILNNYNNTDDKCAIIQNYLEELSVPQNSTIFIELPENRHAYLLDGHHEYYAIFN